MGKLESWLVHSGTRLFALFLHEPHERVPADADDGEEPEPEAEIDLEAGLLADKIGLYVDQGAARDVQTGLRAQQFEEKRGGGGDPSGLDPRPCRRP